MKKRVLFGTGSQAKLDHVRTFLQDLPIEVISPRDMGIDIRVQEDGQSPEENALKKAQAYFAEARIPTFAIDAGLRIERLRPEKQPGVFVRRIYGSERDATDREIVEYYARELDRVGGMSRGTWLVAIALITAAGQSLGSSYSLETMLTRHASDILIPGMALSSLIIDPATGRYESELTICEHPHSKFIVEILRQHLEKL